MVVDPEYYNFGDVEKGALVESSVTIKNLSAADLDVFITTSCACLVFDQNSVIISPNTEIIVNYSFNSADYSGAVAVEAFISVSSIDYFSVLTIAGNVVGKTSAPARSDGIFKKAVFKENLDVDNIDKDTTAFISYKSCKTCVKIYKTVEKWNKASNIDFYALENQSNKTGLNKMLSADGSQVELPILVYNGLKYSGKKEIENLLNNKEASSERNNIKKINLLGTMIAGLLDGINPCAFTVIILLISYLGINLKNRGAILLSGIFFITAVFFTYFLIGIGIFEALRQLTAFIYFSIALKYALSVLLLVLAGISLYDFFCSLKNDNDKMILKLPNFLQKQIRSSIRTQMEDFKIIAGSLFLGFIISLFELVCTGQVYFPIIGYMIRSSDSRAQGFLYLIFYNLSFIIPLVIVFLLVFFGISSKKIGTFFGKRLKYVKLAFFILFIVFAFINFFL
ncbi:MAG TPA: DUF1573 domain-containing protein [Spirochaetota bacterium]|nr:DUF1573 domain-containing protein [Spirochaetota bacterium]HOS32436.1 DUF1573 domain-containing protein [Spirochaetota bacterium]HOS55901.1 DUF1573 domain-containing protein [Spirochaetota bacterium]HQF77483.1 DUF1573 domain-containing protein [Spirochaetota bacterium]HQH30229.1 DUF1573 domain-containing protein [Spirochaetota bacterium]